MIEVVVTMLKQIFSIIPLLIILYYVFDFLGSFFFSKR